MSNKSDFLASALDDVGDIIPTAKSSPNKDDDLSPPNFDRFLGRKTTATETPAPPRPSIGNKVDKKPGLSYPPPPVHHHQQPLPIPHHTPLGMPRYFPGHQQQYMNQSIAATNTTGIPQYTKQQLIIQPAVDMAKVSDTSKPLLKQESDMSALSNNSQQQYQEGSADAAAAASRNSSLTNSIQTESSPLPHPSELYARQRSSLSSAASALSQQLANRQKTDKAVEVHHNNTIIARFRTQTECARYLRATPEAVSYHCSKGGGTCNGLEIKPLNADQQRFGLEQQLALGNNTPYYGLFNGATQYRPAKRPQLKPETVAILKEWLLSPEHMDNPYPNQGESEMLMEQTGLDKTQLKHWFNNARKRILKPLLKNGGLKRGTRNNYDTTTLTTTNAGSSEKRKRGSIVGSGGIGSNEPPTVHNKKKSKKRRSEGEDSLLTNPSSNLTSSQMQQNQQQYFHQGQGLNQYDHLMASQFNAMNNMSQGGMMGGNAYDHDPVSNMLMSQPQMNPMMVAGYGGRGWGYPPAAGANNSNGMYNNVLAQGGNIYGNNALATQAPLHLPSKKKNQVNTAAPLTTGAAAPGDTGGATTDRSQAVFKQQVATMAMTEASNAFKDMEDAFAQAKAILAQCQNNENDPRYMEANDHAKKCQSVAMFKLKVSQRASEEAATAYDSYHEELTDELKDGGGGDGGKKSYYIS